MSETITGARRRRGTARGRITRVERDISSLEKKARLLPSDFKTIKRLRDDIKEHDAEFENRHVEVLDFIDEEDPDTLKDEE